MAIRPYAYFYDGQTRRFLEQIVRAFSGFQYMTGRRGDIPPQLRMVPCHMAPTDRMVAHIMRNQSENTLLAVPMITVYVTSLNGRRDALQNPHHVDTRIVVERERLPDGTYGPARGDSYTVERLMPRPFELKVNVDVWTSNMDQKFQLLEQILTIIYPTFDIQNSENPLDWSAMTTMLVDDGINFSSRSVPVGTESEIDIMTIPLTLPFWLSPPAKVTRAQIVEQIVANIADMAENEDGETVAGGRWSQRVITPGMHPVRLESGFIRLLAEDGDDLLPTGQAPSWSELLQQYGPLRPGISRIRLKPINATDVEDMPEVIGTIQPVPGEPSLLAWQVDLDTLPGNTMLPVDGVIYPLKTFPGNGLPSPVLGQRYLLLSDVGPSVAWPGLTAREGDIIQWDGAAWIVSFQAATSTTVQHVLNLNTGKQLRWTGTEWVLSIEATYAPGYWRLSL